MCHPGDLDLRLKQESFGNGIREVGMTHGLHAHRNRYPEFLQVRMEQGLLTAGIVVVTLLILAILIAGISLVEQTNSLLPPT
jgi:hypothetical protein